MRKLFKNPLQSLTIILLASIMTFVSGCMSGGFKLTRSYAQFVNKQNIILRVVLYILTFVVFGVTLLIDSVIFNTMDFWEGRVSAGDFQFSEGERTFHVKHEIILEGSLKRSTIKVLNKNKELIQTVILSQTLSGEIEQTVDGVIRAKVKDLSGIPVAQIFDDSGSMTSEKVLFVEGIMPLMAQKVQ